jgi:hypothetical protein
MPRRRVAAVWNPNFVIPEQKIRITLCTGINGPMGVIGRGFEAGVHQTVGH